MGKLENKLLLWIVGLALSGLGSITAAIAAPPTPLRTGPTALRTAPTAPGTAMHLDLHAPTSAIGIAEKSSAMFPSLHRRTMAGEEQLQLPIMGAETPHSRIPGPAEEFARRVRREGLPVARLWENHSALVSLGLNQRGKPGLWIIQKMH
jgi:hypothetical protein